MGIGGWGGMGTAGVAMVASCWIHAPEAPAPSAAAIPQGGGAAAASTSTSTTAAARLRSSASYTSARHRSEGSAHEPPVGSHDGFLGLTNASTCLTASASISASAASASARHLGEGREQRPASHRSIATVDRFTNASTDGNATNRFMAVELDAPKQRVCIAVCLSPLSLPPLLDPGANNPPSTNAIE
uniref:Uncharacterized protein n=1 Tax=Oryza meridionalis TaxID=40149 RepID=A0A0E0EXK1_9ORYZ